MIPIKMKNPEIGDYSVAPYNFVSFPNKAIAKYEHPSQLPAHNNFINKDGKELLSGIIEYTIEAKTPIIVSSGEEDKNIFFFKNLDGEYAIPGNTIRGVMRTNSQILSFSNIIKTDDDGYGKSEVQDSRFLFRDVAGGNALSDFYNKILNIDPKKRVSRNLKAGYIYYKDKEYYIEESEKLTDLRNYFRVSELELRHIAEKDIKKDISFMYKAEILDSEERIKELNKIMAPNNRETSKNEKGDARREKLKILRDNKNKDKDFYKEYILEVSFGFDKTKNKVTKVGNKATYPNKGFLLSGGFIDGKMSHYIVPAPSEPINRFKISESDIVQYMDDLILTKKMDKLSRTINRGKEFFDLPKPGEKKPIFFINTDRLHFGFTPYIRMFYSKSILDGIRPEYKDVKGISYTDSIYGFSNMRIGEKKYSYKSRLSFEDAIAENGVVDKNSSIQMLLAEPKATSYNLYLEQDLNDDKKKLKIYDGDFNIRGIKQYWMKNYIEEPATTENQNMTSNIYPLKEGTIFKGKIHFKNLEEDELGLVLWSLRLNENSYQNIGLAKPYGFGRVQLKKLNLKIENFDKKYKDFSFDFMDIADADKYIIMYKDKFSKDYLDKLIDEQTSIKELMYIKSKVVEEKDSNWYRHMLLSYKGKNLKEFTEKKALPSILQYSIVMQKKSIESSNKSGKGKSNWNTGNQSKSSDNKSYKNKKDSDKFGTSFSGLANWDSIKNKN